MEKIFILEHVHEFPDDRGDEIKIIGVYESLEAAQQAQMRAQTWRGFYETKEDFQINDHDLDVDCWTSGFVTMTHRE